MFLYIDGLFWGVYMMIERPDAKFAASYLGGDSTQWEANNAGHEVDGSRLQSAVLERSAELPQLEHNDDAGVVREGPGQQSRRHAEFELHRSA